ncbi:TRAD1 protein, partial [Alcedo cyanopectus]|nr:TRAD1 protein [Ceyx cyanopectus]
EEDEVEQLGSRGNTHSPLYDEWNTDLDYVLALSLQNQWDPPRNTAAEGPGDWWGSHCNTELVPFTHLRGTDKTNTSSCDKTIMLPCEFCEELYPAEDLILHQTGCNPASAFASFSKRSSSPNLRAYGGLRAVGSRSWRAFSASQPRGVQAEEDIMIPCEFCGIQLEEETLFHHQHHCDLRPASPADGFSPPQPQGHRRHSPEVTRRQLRHQGA